MPFVRWKFQFRETTNGTGKMLTSPSDQPVLFIFMRQTFAIWIYL